MSSKKSVLQKKSSNTTPLKTKTSIINTFHSLPRHENIVNSRLEEPITDRVMKDVPYPVSHKLSSKEVFDENDKPRIEIIKQHFYNEGRLTDEAASKIIAHASAILHNEPTVHIIKPPVCIVGDIHGQFYDLLTAINNGGNPQNNRYLFLGDYVDRGHFSMEVLLYLYSLKILYPNTFYLLRGNHECINLTSHFTFKKECLVKYTIDIYDKCTASFNDLPLAAVVNDQFLCVHAGISKDAPTINDIKKIDRFKEPPQCGAMCDLLWSDPTNDFGNERSREHFLPNSTRGCSYYYTYGAVNDFLHNNNSLLSVIRAHEAQDLGFRTYTERPPSSTNAFPPLLTIFSAPNYLDVYNNKGAVIVYDNNTLNVKQFGHAPHPYWLPNFMDVFSWSLPFIAEKITDMLYTILNKLEDTEEPIERRKVIRQKILAIGRLANIYKEIRTETEAVTKLKGITAAATSPVSSLINPETHRKSSADAIKKHLGDDFQKNRRLSFDQARELDRENEQLPKTGEYFRKKLAK
jgi:serine/threonine-protein phosphatase 2B catalytic subunit